MGSALGKVTEEQPRYEVRGRSTDGSSYEVRAYEPCCVIETSYAAKKMVGGDQGGSFMALARYIGVMSKPENARREKIAMTAPVFMAPSGTAAEEYVMQFVLPKSKFARGAADAPEPKYGSKVVVVKDLPARLMAVRRFSGRMCDDRIASESAVLREALAADGVVAVDGAKIQYAGYNPPWTPGPLRTNEVMIEIQSAPIVEAAAA